MLLGLRAPAQDPGALLAVQHLRPRRQHLPVLRPPLPRAELNLDHVVPRSRGGLDVLGERRLLLHPLQPAERWEDAGEAGMRLIRQPVVLR